jgi:hypothetical protein
LIILDQNRQNAGLPLGQLSVRSFSQLNQSEQTEMTEDVTAKMAALIATEAEQEGEELTALIADHLDVITLADNCECEERGQLDCFDFHAVPSVCGGIEVTIHYSDTRRKKIVCDDVEHAAEELIDFDLLESKRRKRRKR